MFEQKHFRKFNFTQKQIEKYLRTAYRDLNIAKQDDIPEVRFQFSYSALIKLGVTLIGCFNCRVKSRSGHHIKILEKTAMILNDKDIDLIGNQMRKTRNMELYEGGVFISKKQSNEYFKFVERVFKDSEKFFKEKLKKLL
ncbi:MAG: hypothetical protein L6275_02485 [Candidatus Portnoybacteria bacterium]|nr:hypothetical protein [Candidatus Portnoybacteria bacterium]